jgi:hypothetical protein
MPQLVAWRCVFGQWLVAPVPVAPHWAEPSMEAVLWGPDRSLFAWTPAAGLALLLAAGSLAVAARRPGRVQPLALLLIAFLVQVYVLASVWGVVYLGASFGLRHLTESLVLLAPGMALALGHLSKWGRRLAGGLGVALAAWNLLLVCQFRYGFVPTEAGAPLTTLLANAWWMARHRQPLVLSHAILGPLLVALACRPAGTRVAPLSLRSSRVARRKQGAKQCVVSS